MSSTPHRRFAGIRIGNAAGHIAMIVTFLLNGTCVEADCHSPTLTLLDWLRENQHLTGTKEGCNEGDCGACSVILTGEDGAAKAMNACILFLPQLHGRAVRTVEGIAGPDGEMHPVQREMVAHHGSQCGFCTPGFITTMAAAHKNGARDHDDQLAGNLCRCTGYAPIVKAAEAAQTADVPEWMSEDLGRLPESTPSVAMPETSDALAKWYTANPDGTLIAGATDVGLWVTKQHRKLGDVAFLGRCTELQQITVSDDVIRIGATATLNAVRDAIAPYHPSFAELIRRYGSVQVRNAATLGGNIANGSPIGDAPPALIALGALLHLRKGDARRDLPLEDFFFEYGKQDRQPSEFVEAVSIPRQRDTLHCHKISKRFDQDISALCGCFNIVVEDGVVRSARIAFGGMAGIPKRAIAVETALTGQPWTMSSVQTAQPAFEHDFKPLSDMRASATYRMQAAKGLLERVFHETQGAGVHVLGVAP